MSKVKAKSYCSPSVVLLAFDWDEGEDTEDFLGFAIQRRPGFRDFKNNKTYSESWLSNRIGFYGPSKIGKDFPTNKCPIQKFLWWDSKFDRDIKDYEYEITPVCGTPPKGLRLIEKAKEKLNVHLPDHVEDGIGTYFNRAVVSSQAFSRRFKKKKGTKTLDEETFKNALLWLSNGMNEVVSKFLENTNEIECAAYHLNDDQWIVPAVLNYEGSISILHDSGDTDNDETLEMLSEKSNIELKARKKIKIMHNKFMVRTNNGEPEALLMGSANFTTAAMTSQANVMHTFESPELAGLYLERKKLLWDNPSKGALGKIAGWSDTVNYGDSEIRVFFTPEKKDSRVSMDTIVEAVENAKQSVIFCLFSPTDKELRDAIFKAGTDGKMMFGLVNKISHKKPNPKQKNVATIAQIEIYNRSKKNKDVFSHDLYPRGGNPAGFWWESPVIPGKKGAKFPVFIHHKFVLIDAETDSPIIYSGSANLSKASLYNNDENLLEIKNNTQLAQIYLCEFKRLFEHYKARVAFSRWEKDEDTTYKLVKTNSWCKKYFEEGTPEYKQRICMV